MAFVQVHSYNDQHGEHFGIIESEDNRNRGRAGFRLSEREFRELLKRRYGLSDEEVNGQLELARKGR